MGIIIMMNNKVLDMQMGNSIRGGLAVDIPLTQT